MNPKNAACVHTVFFDDNRGVFSAYNDSDLTLPILLTSGIFGAGSDGSMSIEDWAIQARQSPYRPSVLDMDMMGCTGKIYSAWQ